MIFSGLSGVCTICAILVLFNFFAKGIMEAVSSIIWFLVCASVAYAICVMLSIEPESLVAQIAVFVIGGILINVLLRLLAAYFRLVAYSINCLIIRFLAMFLCMMLAEGASVGLPAYVMMLFLFPRLMWISDRTSTVKEYHHTTWFTNTAIYYVFDVDNWENTADSWNHLPIQIVIASIFYLISNLSVLPVAQSASGWIIALCLLGGTTFDVAFDIFVFHRIDDKFN